MSNMWCYGSSTVKSSFNNDINVVFVLNLWHSTAVFEQLISSSTIFTIFVYINIFDVHFLFLIK